MAGDELALADSRSEYKALMERIDRDKPAPQDLMQLRGLVAGDQVLLRQFTDAAGDLARIVQAGILQRCRVTGLQQEQLLQRFLLMRQELGYEAAGALERILIDHVAICWFRLYVAELVFTTKGYDECDRGARVYHERLLGAAQRRFLKASVTLARVRKLALPDLIALLKVESAPRTREDFNAFPARAACEGLRRARKAQELSGK